MLAPIIAGYMFRGGYGLQFVAIAMSAGSLIGAVALWLLPLNSPRVAAPAGGRPDQPQRDASMPGTN
jgi:hypothetical protein